MKKVDPFHSLKLLMLEVDLDTIKRNYQDGKKVREDKIALITEAEECLYKLQDLIEKINK